MVDITKCNDKECKQRHECLLFTAKSNEYRQYYFNKSPIEDNKCSLKKKINN
ncbi:MAG: hypothetical protein RI943_1240 [Bacteroidota bacterium]|jgi:hypothetical protein